MHRPYRTSLVSALCYSVLTVSVASQQVRESARIDIDFTRGNFDISADSSGNLTAVAYMNGTSVPSPDFRVVCSVSDGRGTSWSVPVSIDDGNGLPRRSGRDFSSSRRDYCRVAGGNVYVVWTEERIAAPGLVSAFSRSTDGGATFEPETKLPSALGANANVMHQRFLTPTKDDLYVLVSVEEPITGQEALVLTVSHDAGLTWSSTPVVRGVDRVTDVDFDVDPAAPMAVHIAWSDARNGTGNTSAYYRRSSDGGTSFDTPESALGAVGSPESFNSVSVAVDAGTDLVGVLWEQDVTVRDAQLQLAVSNDAGGSFSPSVLVGDYSPGVDDVNFSTVEAIPGALIMVWADNRSRSDELVYTQSWSGAGLAPSDTALSDEGTLRGRFDVVATRVGGAVAVVYTRRHRQSEAFITVSTDGTTWSNPVEFAREDVLLDSTVALDSAYRNFVTVHSGYSLDQRATEVAAGGFRIPTLNLNGWRNLNGPANTMLQFSCEGFGEDRLAAVLVSPFAGSLPTGDGRMIDVGPSSFVLTPQFLVFLNGAGSGTTRAMRNPFAGFSGPNELILHFAAIGFDGSGRVSRITDSIASGVRF